MSEVTLPATRVVDIEREGRSTVRLFIGWPDTPPPAEGYPVVYVLDGNDDFPVALASLRAQSSHPALTHVEPAIVVGIGYADEDGASNYRACDYTPAAPRERLPNRPDGSAWPEIGGASGFLRFIEEKVKPVVGSSFSVNQRRQFLLGHSFGGLFALHAAFTAPHLYKGYYASSPSIWFADRFILTLEEEIERRLGDLDGRRDLMISVGALEQTVPDDRQDAAGRRYVDWVVANRMVDNARELASRMRRHEDAGLNLHFFVFEDETHMTSPPLAIGRALRIALHPGA